MEKFRIFNRSSENMHELADDSIDLVVTDPPFNIGTCYDGSPDNTPYANYVQMIERVISEIARVVKPEGLSILLLPERVQYDGEIHDYPEVFGLLAIKAGLHLRDSFSYDIREDDSEDNIRPLTAFKDLNPLKNFHSHEIRGMVFGDHRVEGFPDGRIYDYRPQEGHPCPYPIELIDDLLNTFFTPGTIVLDTFMGTAKLGVEVLKRGGLFAGYELSEKYYQTAKEKLEQTS